MLKNGFEKIDQSVKNGATPELRAGGFILSTANTMLVHKNEPDVIESLAKELVAQQERLAGEIVRTV